MTDATINNFFIDAVLNKTTGKTITAYFKNGSEGSFSADMLNELKSDAGTRCIIDNETGEIIYIND